jgi:hypothetical protein
MFFEGSSECFCRSLEFSELLQSCFRAFSEVLRAKTPISQSIWCVLSGVKAVLRAIIQKISSKTGIESWKKSKLGGFATEIAEIFSAK